MSLASLFAGFGFIWRKQAGAGRDLARSLRRAAGRRDRAAADLREGHPRIPVRGASALLRAAPAVGALAVGLVLAHSPLERHVGRRMFVSVAIYGVAIVVFGLSRDFALSLVALAVSGGADMVSVVIRQTLVQLDTPDDMRGRVSAVNGIFIGASNELGEFRAGTVAEWLGRSLPWSSGGVGTLVVAALWMKWFPALARRDRLLDRGA